MNNKFIWYLFVFLCISIGLYPLVYFFIERNFGLLATKGPLILEDIAWNAAFYTHIVLGGIALLIGWMQFSVKSRSTYIQRHKILGKIYTFSVLLSAIAGIYIGFYATGGFISSLGFITLGLVWFYTTLMAWYYIRKLDIVRHQKMMYLSYAACFAAVTLRIWLPALTTIFGDFNTAYRIVAWLCWVPNLILALFLIGRIELQKNQ
jgi:hypothetical protein